MTLGKEIELVEKKLKADSCFSLQPGELLWVLGEDQQDSWYLGTCCFFQN